MLWKIHKVLNKTPLIEPLFNKHAGLQMFWEVFFTFLTWKGTSWNIRSFLGFPFPET